jgi:hypothetical protein
MSNLINFNKQCLTEYKMQEAIEQLESRGLSIAVFIARLRGIDVDAAGTQLLHIDNLIIGFGGKERWLAFLNGVAMATGYGRQSMGSHEDFEE